MPKQDPYQNLVMLYNSPAAKLMEESKLEKIRSLCAQRIESYELQHRPDHAEKMWNYIKVAQEVLDKMVTKGIDEKNIGVFLDTARNVNELVEDISSGRKNTASTIANQVNILNNPSSKDFDPVSSAKPAKGKVKDD